MRFVAFRLVHSVLFQKIKMLWSYFPTWLPDGFWTRSLRFSMRIWMYAFLVPSIVGKGSLLRSPTLSSHSRHWQYNWFYYRRWRQSGSHRIDCIRNNQHISRGMYLYCPSIMQTFPFPTTNRIRRTLHPIPTSIVGFVTWCDIGINDHNSIAVSLLDHLLDSPIDLRAKLISTVVVSGEGQAVTPLLEQSIRQTCLNEPKYEKLRAVIDKLHVFKSGEDSVWRGYYVYLTSGIRRITYPKGKEENGKRGL